MLVLDTNVVSELFRPEPAASVAGWYQSQVPENLFVTAITKAESLLGVALMPPGRRKQALGAALTRFYGERLPTAVLAFGPAEAEHFATIVSNRRATGRRIGEFDAQIAAIARSHGFAVVTRNVQDFEGCGIEIVNPWDGP
jgi:toxin FitB